MIGNALEWQQQQPRMWLHRQTHEHVASIQGGISKKALCCPGMLGSPKHANKEQWYLPAPTPGPPPGAPT